VSDLYYRFRALDGLFAKPCANTEDPRVYWMSFKGYQRYTTLVDLALSVLDFPQSSAAAERSFSVIRHIHTWKRNKLGRKKLAKLVYIYTNITNLCLIIEIEQLFFTRLRIRNCIF